MKITKGYSGIKIQNFLMDSVHLRMDLKYLILICIFACCLLPIFSSALTYTVTTTTDGAGAGTLRTAITNANTNLGSDVIVFTVSGTITLTSALPALTDDAGVTINGNTATGYVVNSDPTWPGSLNGNLTLTINGNNAVTTGITVSSDNNIIRGLNFINIAVGIPDICIDITSGADNNYILGCYIGTDVTGTASAGANTEYGVRITSAINNKIGDGTAAGRNLISGLNAGGYFGIGIYGASTGNTIKGNIIGLQKDGATYLATTQSYGVEIGNGTGSSGNTIGGTAAGEGNVISGNGTAGILLDGVGVAGNSVLGNIIGPQADGTSNVASNPQSYGIWIGGFGNSPNNIIGDGTVAGRNILSANTSMGVYIRGASGAGSTGNSVKGNYIGIAQNGTAFIAGSTQDYGVYITSSASNTIGGTVAGEDNVISGNKGAADGYGVYITGSAATGNSVLGNIIGPQADGTSYVTSNAQTYGVYITGSPNNTIGGSVAEARNIISANETSGVYMTGAGSAGNSVKGNYIGIDKNGTAFIAGSTQDYGVRITSSAASNTIGGAVAGEGNVISGNKDAASTGKGVDLSSTAAAGNSVLGNIIGPQANGTSNVASNLQTYGVYITGSKNNAIGGSASGAGNIISANETYGVFMTGATTAGNLVKGNLIGPSSATVSITSSSQDYGVYIQSSAKNNTIGGTVAGEANTIAFNTTEGVYLTGAASSGNKISRNPIYSNGAPVGTGKPINLNGGANNGKAIPVITGASTTLVTGTGGAGGIPGDIVEVFKNTIGPPCYDAVTFIGDAVVDGSNNWSLTPAVALTLGDYVLATITDASNNTSEFTTCTGPLPVELLSFSAVCLRYQAEIKWVTASETNNDYFTIERAINLQGFQNLAGLEWKVVGTVKGAGNSSNFRNYEFVDTDIPSTSNPQPSTLLYYRLKQTDFDGKYEYFTPVSVKCENGNFISIYPNPASEYIHYTVGSEKGNEVTVKLYDALGREVLSKTETVEAGVTEKKLPTAALSNGAYLLKITNGKYEKTQKLFIIK